MIVGELTFYRLVGAAMTVAFVFFAVAVRQFSGRKLRYMVAAPFFCAVLALGYFGMSVELLTLFAANGRPVPLSRFAVYMTSYTAVIAYIGVVGGASRKHLLLGVGLLVSFTSGTFINWLFVPPIENVGKLLFLASLIGMFWLLFRPYTEAAESVSGPRRLAFGKMRNLMALLLLMYFLVGLTARQSLGLLDTFTGVYMGGYMDMLGHLGMAGILLRSEEAIEELAGERSSPLSYLRESQSPPPETAAGD